MIRKMVYAVVVAITVAMVSNPVLANDKVMNIQGKLTDINGQPFTGEKELYFYLYDDIDDLQVNNVWSELHSVDLQTDGLFNERLGTSQSLDNLDFSKQYYLGVVVNGVEVLPRQPLGASSYSFGSVGNFNVGKNLVVANVSKKYVITRDIPTALNNYVEIGNINNSNAFTLKLSAYSNGGHLVAAKEYDLAVNYHTAQGWRVLSPITTTEGSNDNDFEIDANWSGSSGYGPLLLRARLSKYSATTPPYGSIKIVMELNGDGVFTETSAGGLTTAPVDRFDITTLTKSRTGTTLLGQTNVIGATSMNGNLNVAGTTNLNGDLNVSGGWTNLSNLKVNSDMVYIYNGGGSTYNGMMVTGWGQAHAGLFWKPDERKFIMTTCDGNAPSQLGVYGACSLDVKGNIYAAQDVYARGVMLTSTIKLKKNVKTIKNPFELINKLRGVTFDWKSDGRHSMGLIAEEVDKVLPELTGHDPYTKEPNSVEYANMVALLIEGMKEQQKQINALQSELKELKAAPRK